MSAAPETLHERGRAALLAGRELLDVPPVAGGTRWGLSLVVRPDAASAERLDALSAEAAALAGPGQWRTGSRASSHLTVCYLEDTYREVVDADPRVAQHAALVAGVAGETAPLRWELTGVALADRGVLALAEPADGRPDGFRVAVLAALGDQGRAESHYRRSVWWSTLLHLAAPVADRAGLVAWADARTGTPFGAVEVAAVEVVRYAFSGSQVVPVTLATVPLAGQARAGAAAHRRRPVLPHSPRGPR